MKVLTQEQYDKMIEILTQHKGKASAITAEQIAEQIGFVETKMQRTRPCATLSRTASMNWNCRSVRHTMGTI